MRKVAHRAGLYPAEPPPWHRRAVASSSSLRAERLGAAALGEPEWILESLELPDEALGNLAHLAGVEEDALREGEGWCARVELGPDVLWVQGDRRTWRIAAPPGTDESDAARAARRLHGLLGEMSEGWDLDR